jgi:hypothetical protein
MRLRPRPAERLWFAENRVTDDRDAASIDWSAAPYGITVRLGLISRPFPIVLPRAMRVMGDEHAINGKDARVAARPRRGAAICCREIGPNRSAGRWASSSGRRGWRQAPERAAAGGRGQAAIAPPGRPETRSRSASPDRAGS